MEPLTFSGNQQFRRTDGGKLLKSEGNLHFSDTPVGVQILRGRLFPIQVLSNAIEHQSPPLLFIRPQRERRMEWRAELLETMVCKKKGGSFVGGGVVFLNGVGQTAGSADYGYRAIAQTVHLVQPTGLVFRRHKKDIGARFNQVSAA